MEQAPRVVIKLTSTNTVENRLDQHWINDTGSSDERKKKGKNIYITQFYLQITLCLLLFRKRSPDGATLN